MCFIVKRLVLGFGKMAQGLRILAALRTGFDSQHPHGGLQPSVTPVPKYPTPQTATAAQTGKIPIHTHKIHNFLFKGVLANKVLEKK